jgi:hypothetical protein
MYFSLNLFKSSILSRETYGFPYDPFPLSWREYIYKGRGRRGNRRFPYLKLKSFFVFFS